MNEPPREHIPGRRRRLVVLLALAAVIGLAAAAAVAVSARDDGSQPAVAAASCRALSGRPPLALDLPGAALPPRQQDNDAVLRAAERRLPAGDVRISVGRLVNAYGSAGAAATLRGLQRLDQSQPVVRLHEGLVELWAGDCTAAERTLQRVRTDDLYGYYGTVADNTLHTDQRPGLPIYIPPDGTPGGTVDQLRARVRTHPDDGPSWLGLAYGEEVGGQPAGGAGGRQAGAAPSTPPPSPRAWRWP